MKRLKVFCNFWRGLENLRYFFREKYTQDFQNKKSKLFNTFRVKLKYLGL